MYARENNKDIGIVCDAYGFCFDLDALRGCVMVLSAWRVLSQTHKHQLCCRYFSFFQLSVNKREKGGGGMEEGGEGRERKRREEVNVEDDDLI